LEATGRRGTPTAPVRCPIPVGCRRLQFEVARSLSDVDGSAGSTGGTKSSFDPGNLDKGIAIDACSGAAEGTKSFPGGVDGGCNLNNGTVIDDGSGTAEGTQPSFSADAAAGSLINGTSIVDGSGTKSSSSADVNGAGRLYRGTTTDDGTGVAEGTKPSSPPDKDVAGSPYSGDETNSSFSDIDGNRHSGTIIEDGSGAAEETRSPSSGSLYSGLLPSKDMECRKVGTTHQESGRRPGDPKTDRKERGNVRHGTPGQGL